MNRISLFLQEKQDKKFALARIIHDEDTAKQSQNQDRKIQPVELFPCINAGNPADRFKDADGSKTTWVSRRTRILPLIKLIKMS